MKPKPFWLSVVVLWFFAISAGLYMAMTYSTPVFDHQDGLYTRLAKPEFNQALTRWIKSLSSEGHGTVIHFIQQGCFCNIVSSRHRQSVEKLASENGFYNQYVEVSPTVAHFLPSTPATAVINKAGKVTYFGPYSSGIYCSASAGLVEGFIEATNSSLPDTVIPLDARGCYCHNS